MIYQGWLFVAAVGVLAAYVTLTTPEDDVAIMFGLVGLLTWGLFSYQSLYIEVLAGGKTDPITYSYPAMSIWGLAMAVTCLYVVINGPIGLIDQRRNKLADDPGQ